jgi:hypothetical protein
MVSLVESISGKLFNFISFSVLSTMNQKYRSTLIESKRLNATGLLQKANANNITADKILYDHAIQMVSFSSEFPLISQTK